jgi:hypothetical protein
VLARAGMEDAPNPLASGKLMEEQMADFLASLDAQKAAFIAQLEAQQLQPTSSRTKADDEQQAAPAVDIEDPQSSGGGGSVAAALVRSHVASMNDAPSNFHQVAVEVCLDTNVDMPRKARYLVASFCIVGLQLLALSGIIKGTEQPACLDSSDCQRGDFCRAAFGQDYKGGTCQQCSDDFYTWERHLVKYSSQYEPRFWLSNNTGYVVWAALRECVGNQVNVEELDDPEWECIEESWSSLSGMRKGEVSYSSSGEVYGRDQYAMFQLNARFMCRDHREQDLTRWEQQHCAGCFDVSAPGDDFNIARSEGGAVFRAISLMNAGECEQPCAPERTGIIYTDPPTHCSRALALQG